MEVVKNSQTTRSVIGIAIATLLGALVAWAGSDGSSQVGAIPLFALCAVLAYLINWLAFVPANAAKTERFYDLTGSITYISVTLAALVLADRPDVRAYVVTGLVVVWALRLGTFLFRRVMRDRGDNRFDEIKVSPIRFFMTWTLQGLWVLLTAAAAWAIITAEARETLGWIGYAGIAIWLVGFAIEALADRQKSEFKKDPDNEGRFISTGLWAWSRHPNYFGEITLWLGVAIIAVPVLSGWRWLVLISPVFVALLITQVSGVPMLERRADERWGGDPDYEAYKRSTPVLIPRPPKDG